VYRMLYGALVVTLWTCYGALQVVVLLLLLLLYVYMLKRRTNGEYELRWIPPNCEMAVKA